MESVDVVAPDDTLAGQPNPVDCHVPHLGEQSDDQPADVESGLVPNGILAFGFLQTL